MQATECQLRTSKNRILSAKYQTRIDTSNENPKIKMRGLVCDRERRHGVFGARGMKFLWNSYDKHALNS